MQTIGSFMEELITLTVVLDCGKLYTCGSNNKGQLGINTTDDAYTLQNVVIDENDKVVMATGGWDFSVAITGLK